MWCDKYGFQNSNISIGKENLTEKAPKLPKTYVE